MHAARLSRSPRLRRVHELLIDGREHSTRDIVRAAHVCAVNSCIAELRENGAVIEGRWETNPVTRERTFLYRMTKPAEAA